MCEEKAELKNSCRLCLEEDSVTFPIFGTAETNGLLQNIYLCTSLEVEEIPGAPSYVCEICKSQLVICARFILKCQQTDLLIRKLYAESFDKHAHQMDQQECAQITLDQVEMIEMMSDSLPDITELDNTVHNTQLTNELFMLEEVNSNASIQLVETVTTIDDTTQEDEETIDLCESPVPDEAAMNNPDTAQPMPYLEGPTESLRSSPDEDDANTQPLAGQVTNDQELHSVVPNDASNLQCEDVVVKEPEIPGDAIGDLFRARSLSFEIEQFYAIIEQDSSMMDESPSDVDTALPSKAATESNSAVEVQDDAEDSDVEHVCEHCGKSFLQKEWLDVHMSTHSEEMPFKCEHCNEGCKSQYRLMIHERRYHHKDLKYLCDYCKKSFLTSDGLRTHIQYKHELTNGNESN